jgi:hypothetical protein
MVLKIRDAGNETRNTNPWHLAFAIAAAMLNLFFVVLPVLVGD